jgi:hypothetical protein
VTFLEEGKKPIVVNNTRPIYSNKKEKKKTKPNKTLFKFFIKNKNDHGLDVNIVMVI